MRIPLLRDHGDTRPIAGWEWLFAPLVWPLAIAVAAAAALLSIPCAFVEARRHRRQEAALRARLTAAGRFLDWKEVELRLRNGQGSLILHYASPHTWRLWWTGDDLHALAPEPLAAETSTEAVRSFAQTCVKRYVDPEAGHASLTDVPAALATPIEARRLVTLHSDLQPPRLYAGDSAGMLPDASAT